MLLSDKQPLNEEELENISGGTGVLNRMKCLVTYATPFGTEEKKEIVSAPYPSGTSADTVNKYFAKVYMAKGLKFIQYVEIKETIELSNI